MSYQFINLPGNQFCRIVHVFVMVLVMSVPALAEQEARNLLQRHLPDKLIIFKSTPQGDLKLHVFLPENEKPDKPRSAIIFFFGGGWNSGMPSQFYPHCRYLADRGMVAFSAEYRVKNKHKTTPVECIEDGKSAVRWVREHAVQWNIDLNRIAVGGWSAGGHIAASTSLISGLDAKQENGKIRSTPDAMFLFNPVLDTTLTGWKAGQKRLGARSRELSPIHYINDQTPATVIFQGTADIYLPYENVERFQKIMRQHHNRCEVFSYAGRPHGFFKPSVNKEDYLDTVSKMDTFLVSLDWLSKP